MHNSFDTLPINLLKQKQKNLSLYSIVMKYIINYSIRIFLQIHKNNFKELDAKLNYIAFIHLL